MKKICFITGTRADYGIMAPVMREVAVSQEGELQVIVTNMHLAPEYGMTMTEIESDGFKVDAKIESFVAGGSPSTTVLSMARVQEGMASALEKLKPDMVVILGDRYEALAAAASAVVFNIPVAHLHGGETSEGAIDDKFRHAITMLATYHFAATPQYMDRIVSMGAKPENVFHSGGPGAEIQDYSDPNLPKDFFNKTGIQPGELFFILAFHPVTNLPDKGLHEAQTTLEALDLFLPQGYKVLVTMPNSDPGTIEISNLLKEWGNKHPSQVVCVPSLGARLFHFAMEIAQVMVGNSSSGLIEAPSHRLPAVNIGLRQKGRAHGPTVLNTPADKSRIVMALNAALSIEMKAVSLGMPLSSLNPYYKENSAKFIANNLLSLCRQK